MDISHYFPVWGQMNSEERHLLTASTFRRHVDKGTLLHNGSSDCTGLLVVISGQLRSFILSSEGREVTIYRLFERDICLFSASCMMNSIQFEINVEAEKDSELWVIPAEIYKQIMEKYDVNHKTIQRALQKAAGYLIRYARWYLELVKAAQI